VRTTTLDSSSANISTVFQRLTLAGLHDEWYALPSWVVDPEDHRRKCGAGRALGHSFVFEIAGLILSIHVLALGVLAEEDVLAFDGGNATKDFDLGSATLNCYLPFHREYPRGRTTQASPWPKQTKSASSGSGRHP